MTDAEKKCLKVLIKVFENNGYTKDAIYERIKITMRPLTSEQYQDRIKFIAQEIGI